MASKPVERPGPKGRPGERSRREPLLPETTTDEQDMHTGFDDDWYLEQRPPHHGS